MKKEMCDLKDTAKYLGVSISYIRKLSRANMIPHYRFGNKIMFERNELDLWIETHRQKEKECTLFL